MPRNWKWQKKKTNLKKAWDWIHTIFQKCNYKAFNHLCCPDRSTLWNHKLENVQFGPNSSSRKEQGIYMYIHMAEGGRTGNTEWTERSLKSSFTTLQLYTSAVGVHKMSYRAVGSMFVDTQQSVQCFCRTHRNKDTLEEVVITKKSTFAAKIYILFLQTNLKVYKYINVSSPSSRFELFLPHLFFIFPSVSWSSGFLRML